MLKKIVGLLSLSLCFSLSANAGSALVISQESKQGIYQSILECKDVFSTGPFQECWLSLLHSGQKAENIEIFIDGGMPIHAHGLQTSPKVVWSEDSKVHLIQGLKFSMPGQWRLNFKVNAKDDDLKDEITFLFRVD